MTFTRYVLRSGLLAKVDDAELIAWLTRSLDDILLGRPPGRPALPEGPGRPGQ